MAKKSKKNSKKASDELIEKLKKHIRQNASKYLEKDNISSVGIGLKITNGKRTNEICLQFTVDAKIELETLESLDSFIIPESIKIDGEEIPTDVIQRKYELSYKIVKEDLANDRKVRHDIIFPGISVCNTKGTAGTLGCIVYDNEDDTPYILSNWHVLHGDDGILDDEIVQPGPHDDNRIQLNNCGTLKRSHLGVAGDCAIATIENRGFSEEIFRLNTSVQELCEPELLDRVIKSGRTTDVTYGIVERIHVVTEIYYGRFTGFRSIGCFEIGVDPDNLPDDGEISSGGDSGACWLIYDGNKATNILAGLHFAGESTDNPHEHALACYPKSVFEKLQIKPSISEGIVVKKSNGYNENFLSTKVSIPTLNDSRIAYKLDGNECIDYTHFSLALNKKRRFAIWVAWNIDGGKIKRLSRNGINFKFDPRIPNKYQIGNDLYKNNDLDRGHIAKRADLVWGTLEKAQDANVDSFYYTNIAPQMNDFNQSSKDGVWGELENAIFEDVKVDDLKISIFGGPIFQADDKEYRGFKIPKEFYKVIVYEIEEKLKCKAFLLSQNLNRLEVLDLDEFKTFEISLNELENRVNFSFDPVLHNAEQLEVVLENLEISKPISNLSRINWF